MTLNNNNVRHLAQNEEEEREQQQKSKNSTIANEDDDSKYNCNNNNGEDNDNNHQGQQQSNEAVQKYEEEEAEDNGDQQGEEEVEDIDDNNKDGDRSITAPAVAAENQPQSEASISNHNAQQRGGGGGGSADDNYHINDDDDDDKHTPPKTATSGSEEGNKEQLERDKEEEGTGQRYSVNYNVGDAMGTGPTTTTRSNWDELQQQRHEKATTKEHQRASTSPHSSDNECYGHESEYDNEDVVRNLRRLEQPHPLTHSSSTSSDMNSSLCSQPTKVTSNREADKQLLVRLDEQQQQQQKHDGPPEVAHFTPAAGVTDPPSTTGGATTATNAATAIHVGSAADTDTNGYHLGSNDCCDAITTTAYTEIGLAIAPSSSISVASQSSQSSAPTSSSSSIHQQPLPMSTVTTTSTSTTTNNTSQPQAQAQAQQQHSMKIVGMVGNTPIVQIPDTGDRIVKKKMGRFTLLQDAPTNTATTTTAGVTSSVTTAGGNGTVAAGSGGLAAHSTAMATTTTTSTSPVGSIASSMATTEAPITAPQTVVAVAGSAIATDEAIEETTTKSDCGTEASGRTENTATQQVTAPKQQQQQPAEQTPQPQHPQPQQEQQEKQANQHHLQQTQPRQQPQQPQRPQSQQQQSQAHQHHLQQPQRPQPQPPQQQQQPPRSQQYHRQNQPQYHQQQPQLPQLQQQQLNHHPQQKQQQQTPPQSQPPQQHHLQQQPQKQPIQHHIQQAQQHQAQPLPQPQQHRVQQQPQRTPPQKQLQQQHPQQPQLQPQKQQLPPQAQPQRPQHQPQHQHLYQHRLQPQQQPPPEPQQHLHQPPQPHQSLLPTTTAKGRFIVSNEAPSSNQGFSNSGVDASPATADESSNTPPPGGAPINAAGNNNSLTGQQQPQPQNSRQPSQTQAQPPQAPAANTTTTKGRFKFLGSDPIHSGGVSAASTDGEGTAPASATAVAATVPSAELPQQREEASAAKSKGGGAEAGGAHQQHQAPTIKGRFTVMQQQQQEEQQQPQQQQQSELPSSDGQPASGCSVAGNQKPPIQGHQQQPIQHQGYTTKGRFTVLQQQQQPPDTGTKSAPMAANPTSAIGPPPDKVERTTSVGQQQPTSTKGRFTITQDSSAMPPSSTSANDVPHALATCPAETHLQQPTSPQSRHPLDGPPREVSASTSSTISSMTNPNALQTSATPDHSIPADPAQPQQQVVEKKGRFVVTKLSTVPLQAVVATTTTQPCSGTDPAAAPSSTLPGLTTTTAFAPSVTLAQQQQQQQQHQTLPQQPQQQQQPPSFATATPATLTTIMLTTGPPSVQSHHQNVGLVPHQATTAFASNGLVAATAVDVSGPRINQDSGSVGVASTAQQQAQQHNKQSLNQNLGFTGQAATAGAPPSQQEQSQPQQSSVAAPPQQQQNAQTQQRQDLQLQRPLAASENGIPGAPHVRATPEDAGRNPKMTAGMNAKPPKAPPVGPHPPRNIGVGLGGQVGLGKALYFLDQMRSELSEGDRTIKTLTADSKFLKEKIKELEAKARESERKWLEEKTRREAAESKVKQLTMKLRASKIEPMAGGEAGGGSAETAKEDLSVGAIDVRSRSNSSDFESDVNEPAPAGPIMADASAAPDYKTTGPTQTGGQADVKPQPGGNSNAVKEGPPPPKRASSTSPSVRQKALHESGAHSPNREKGTQHKMQGSSPGQRTQGPAWKEGGGGAPALPLRSGPAVTARSGSGIGIGHPRSQLANGVNYPAGARSGSQSLPQSSTTNDSAGHQHHREVGSTSTSFHPVIPGAFRGTANSLRQDIQGGGLARPPTNDFDPLRTPPSIYDNANGEHPQQYGAPDKAAGRLMPVLMMNQHAVVPIIATSRVEGESAFDPHHQQHAVQVNPDGMGTVHLKEIQPQQQLHQERHPNQQQQATIPQHHVTHHAINSAVSLPEMLVVSQYPLPGVQDLQQTQMMAIQQPILNFHNGGEQGHHSNAWNMQNHWTNPQSNPAQHPNSHTGSLQQAQPRQNAGATDPFHQLMRRPQQQHPGAQP